MKKFLCNLLLLPTLFTSIFSGYGKIMLAVPIIVPIISINNNSLGYEYKMGKLSIDNYVYDYDFDRTSHSTFHRPEGTEGYDNNPYLDRIYDVIFSPSGKATKIVSKIPGYELLWDSRRINSFTPVDLELSLHAQSGNPITVSNLKNELRCYLPYDFGSKPITLWERTIIAPNNDPNDPNNYTLSFMADIREAIAKQEAQTVGYAVVPLADLNGTYGSEVPYFYAQIRFDRIAGDFNLDGKVGLDDFAYFAQDWNASDVNSVADISGPNGLPDKNVNAYDLSLFTRDYLKDANDPNTWSRVR